MRRSAAPVGLGAPEAYEAYEAYGHLWDIPPRCAESAESAEMPAGADGDETVAGPGNRIDPTLVQYVVMRVATDHNGLTA